MLDKFTPGTAGPAAIAERLKTGVYLMRLSPDLTPDMAHQLAQFLSRKFGWMVLIDTASPPLSAGTGKRGEQP